jgi:signal transduction histidine kinase
MTAAMITEVAEQLPLGVFIVDGVGTPVFVNKVGTGLLGAGVVGAARVDNLAETYQVYEIATGELYPQERLPVVRALAGETVVADDCFIRRPEGNVPLRVWASPVRDDTGQVEAAVAVFWDATEDNDASRSLSTLFTSQQQDAAELDRLRELRIRFITAVNHEFRTPMTALAGAIETLHQAGDRLDVTERAELIGRARTNAHRLQNLLTDVLELSGGDADRSEVAGTEFDLADAVRQAALNIDICERHLIVDTAPVFVSANQPQLERVVRALLDNTVRHTPAGTNVWLSAFAEGTGAVIEVSDSGPGIPEHLREQVLQPFEQGQASRPHAPGLGIGLALVARFVDTHGGRLFVDARPGGGTRVRIRLRSARLATAPDQRTP